MLRTFINDVLWLPRRASYLSVIAICVLVLHVLDVNAGTIKEEMAGKIFTFNKEKIFAKSACSLGNNQFEMVITSPSGDITEDDSSLWFLNSGQAVNATPGKAGYIQFFPAISNTVTICKDTAAFELIGGSIAVPFFLSNRPDLDLLAVAVYDPQNAKVLKYAVIERYYGGTPTLRAIKGGFSYLAVSGQPNDGPKGLVEMWLNITWDGKQIIKKWDSSRPKVRH